MDNARLKNKVLSEKKSLEDLLARVNSESMVEDDSWKVVNEIGDESLEQISLLSKQEQREGLEGLLRRVNQALEDIENNRYGICNRCESSIEEGRLEAYPYAQYCLKCQEVVDQQD